MNKPKYRLIASGVTIDSHGPTLPKEWCVIRKIADKGKTPFIPKVVGFTKFIA